MNLYLPNRQLLLSWRRHQSVLGIRSLQLSQPLIPVTAPALSCRFFSSWQPRKGRSAISPAGARNEQATEGGWPHRYPKQEEDSTPPAAWKGRQTSSNQLADLSERLGSLPDSREEADNQPGSRGRNRGGQASSSGRSFFGGRDSRQSAPLRQSAQQHREPAGRQQRSWQQSSYARGADAWSDGAAKSLPARGFEQGSRPGQRRGAQQSDSGHSATWQQRQDQPWQNNRGAPRPDTGRDRRAWSNEDQRQDKPWQKDRGASRSGSWPDTGRDSRKAWSSEQHGQDQPWQNNRGASRSGSWSESGRREYDSRTAPTYGAYNGTSSRMSQGYGSIEADKGPSLQHRLQGEALYGVSPIAAAIAAGRRKLYTLYIQEGLKAGKRNDSGACKAAIAAAETLGVIIEEVPKHELNLACDNRPHQGLVLDCQPLQMQRMNTFPPPERNGKAPYPVWLVLDEIYDPQNLGAVLRSAHFLGATGVLCCARNTAPLSPVVAKASAGALDAMEVHCCNSMPRTLNAAASDGWLVLGADVSDGAVECAQYHLPGPALVVLGSEGAGLRPLVRSACTQLIRIGPSATPKAEAVSNVDSLNVSVAAGVMLHHLLHGQGSAAPQNAAPPVQNGVSLQPETELSGFAREELGAIA